MKQVTLQEKYPVYHMELGKGETSMGSVDDIIAYYKAKVEETEGVAYIATFDHHGHTTAIGGEIDPGISAAKNIVFCFGFKLPNAGVLAVRPRSIGVADLGERFEIAFLEAPMPQANEAMEAWTRALRDR